MKNITTKSQLKEATDYIKKSKKFIYFSIALFVIITIIGYAISEHLTFLDSFLKELIQKTEGLNTPEMIFFILQNNLQSALFSIVLGIFLALFPLGSIIANGTVMGYVLARTQAIAGISSWWRLLPHGIFELPAIFISFGIGIKLGHNTLKTYINHYKKERIMIYLPAIIAIILFVISSIGAPISKELPVPEKFAFLSIIWILIFFTFLAYIAFIFITQLFDKKFRKKLNKNIKQNFYDSMNVFLMIIVPLLIIAAIIEGTLIILLG